MNPRLLVGSFAFLDLGATLHDLGRQLGIVAARSSASNLYEEEYLEDVSEYVRQQREERWRRAIPAGPVAAAARPVRERAPASPCLPAPWPLQLRAFGAR